MTEISGIYCCPRLICLRPLLTEWIKLNKRIAKSWRPANDAPWWYNERASLSTLAGAVWQVDGIAFEEYSDRKRTISRTSGLPSKKYPGRVDLFMEFNRHEFKGEAKFHWVGISTDRKDRSKTLEKYLDNARHDTRKNHPDRQQRLAIVFVTPYISRKKKQQSRELIQRFVDQLKDVKADAVAWVFPSIEKSIHLSGQLFPGAAVIIREVKK